LQCVAVCCSVLQCVAVRARYRDIYRSPKIAVAVASAKIDVLQCAIDIVLQCVAVCCSVLQCVAVCCSVQAQR